jgi:hypothetical protein
MLSPERIQIRGVLQYHIIALPADDRLHDDEEAAINLQGSKPAT